MTLMWEEILEQPAVLQKCLDNNKIINDIKRKMASTDIRFVVIAGRGTSDHAAIYGKYIIECMLGMPVSLAAPSIITTYDAEVNYRNCLVIAVSQSGQAKDALEIIRQGNRCEAVTVGITNDEGSPIAKEAHFHLFTDAGPEKSVAATKTFTAQMMLLAHLVAELKAGAGMMKELSMVPKRLYDVIALKDEINATAVSFSHMRHCFVLARGMNYPIALEAALKIQETSYVEAEGFAISDFYHGPIAMVDRKTPVLLFSPRGSTMSDSIGIIERLDKLKANVLLVTNDKDLASKSSFSFIIPDTDNDVISPFYNAVFSQMFACSLSLAKGFDPDRPRSLKKVTITK
jgi:glutamine---fructose-6-phosphate transaminase (isomerizing)